MDKTIMIIDDSAALRMSVQITLETANYKVIEASEGEDALRKLNDQKIDMFICDVNMPKMDGISFLKTIKNDRRFSSYRFTPFLMLTTESGTEMKNKGMEAGAKAWIVKPFQQNVLLDAVKKLIV